jgi:uncharacterized membrane protein YfcA
MVTTKRLLRRSTWLEVPAVAMNSSEVILFVALGAVVGFAGGLFAIGGALIAIPLLAAGFGFTQHDSQGTAMVMALAS